MERERFKKRKGTGSVEGEFYELKLTMFAYLQCLISWRSGDIQRFWIAKNISGYGDFDDVFVKYTKNNKTTTHLIQAKHRMDRTKAPTNIDTLLTMNDKNDFSLKKYIKSYTEGADLVLYTNNTFKLNKVSRHEEELAVDGFLKELAVDGFLKDLSRAGQRYRIVFSDHVYSVLKHTKDFVELSDEMNKAIHSGQIDMEIVILNKYNSFLREYVISVEDNVAMFKNEFIEADVDLRRDVRELRNKLLENKGDDKFFGYTMAIVNSTSAKEWDCSGVLVYSEKYVENFLNSFKLFFDQLDVNEVERSVKQKMASCYNLDNVEDVYLRAFKRICDWWSYDDYYLTEKDDIFLESLMLELTTKTKATVEQFGIVFAVESIDGLLQTIRKYNIIKIMIGKETKILNKIKLFQVLDFIGEKYCYMEMTNYRDVAENVAFAFRGGINTFAIEFNGSSPELEKLVDQLSKQTSMNEKKLKLIIMCEQILVLGSTENSIDFDDVRIRLTDLDDKTRTKLRGRKVNFQGTSMRLESSVQKEFEMSIDQEFLVKLVRSEVVKIGMPITKMDNTRDVYVDRTLIREIRVDMSCFKDREFKLAISGMREEYIRYLENPSECIFRCDVDDFVKNMSSNLRIFVLSDRNPQSDFERISLIYPQVHWLHLNTFPEFTWRRSNCRLSSLRKYLIGGLSYTLPSLIEDDNKFVIVTADPGMGKSMIVGKIHENTVDEKSLMWKVRIDLNEHRMLLKSIKTVDDSSVYEFLKDVQKIESDFERELFHFYYHIDGRIMLLFDGFDEICVDLKERVIDMFRILKESKVRKVLITTRPHECEHLENTLCTFAYSLRQFLKEEQRQFLKLKVVQHLGNDDWMTCNLIIENIFACISHRSFNQPFLTNPLHLNMICEYVFRNVKDVNDLLDSVWNWRLLDLFEHFIKRKFYDIYCEDKGNAKDPEFRDFLFDSFVRHKKREALVEVFGDNAPNPEPTVDQGCNWIKIGVVHRTFYEYLAGIALFEQYSIDRRRVAKFFERVLFYSPQYDVVRRFFDSSCASSIHEAVLGNSLIDASFAAQIDERDKAGRTALHLAVSYDNLPSLHHLIQLDASLELRDEIHGWTPVAYAMIFRNVRALFSLILLDDRRYEESIASLENYGLENSVDRDLRQLFEKQFFTDGGFMAPAHIGSYAVKLSDIILDKHIVVNKMEKERQREMSKTQTNCEKHMENNPLNYSRCTTEYEKLLSLEDRNNSFFYKFPSTDLYPDDAASILFESSKSDLCILKNEREFYSTPPGVAFHTWMNFPGLWRRPEKIYILLNRPFFGTSEAPMYFSKESHGETVDLKTFKVENINETGVRDYISESLFLKHGRDIDSFEKYYGVFELWDLELNADNRKLLLKFAQTVRGRNDKVYIRTQSNILLYHLGASHISEIDLKDLRRLLVDHDQRFLSTYFDYERLVDAFDEIDCNQAICALIDCLKVNVGVNVELDPSSSRIELTNLFPSVELDWETVKPILSEAGDMYSRIHAHFVAKCDRKCDVLMARDDTRLLFEGYDEVQPQYRRPVMEMMKILRESKIGMAVIMASLQTFPEIQCDLHASAYFSYVDSVDALAGILKERWKKYLKFTSTKATALVYQFLGEFMKFPSLNQTPLHLDSVIDYYAKIFEDLEKYPFGIELVLLQPLNYIDLNR